MSVSTKRQHRPVDVRIEHHGSLYLLRPLSDAAASWFVDNVGGEVQYFGGALVAEPRYVGELLQGLRADGLVAQ
jgi:hypothetical protein